MRLGFLVFAGLLCLAGLSAAAKDPLRLTGLRYGPAGSEGTRIVLDLSAPPDFRARIAAGPDRLIVDLPGLTWDPPATRPVKNRLVAAARLGATQGQGARIVFDLKRPAVLRAAFAVPAAGKMKDRLVLDLDPAAPSVKKALPKNDDTAPAPLPQKKYTIVIDAGHGGQDPGAISHGVQEKNITLAAALALKRMMEDSGRYRVVLTRDADVYITLRDRVHLSREVGADLFISLHADKVERDAVRGASIYTLSETASDVETARLAEQENNAGFVAGVDLSQESQDVADILLDLAMREKMNESNLFAQMIKTSFRQRNIRLLPNSHRSAGFAVLKAPDVPSVLIEMGFLSHAEEVNLLVSKDFQQNLARAVLDGVDDYFRKISSLKKR